MFSPFPVSSFVYYSRHVPGWVTLPAWHQFHGLSCRKYKIPASLGILASGLGNGSLGHGSLGHFLLNPVQTQRLTQRNATVALVWAGGIDQSGGWVQMMGNPTSRHGCWLARRRQSWNYSFDEQTGGFHHSSVPGFIVIMSLMGKEQHTVEATHFHWGKKQTVSM